ncbi:MAG: urea carboxylase-associated family protein [Proteobacteria bacterium]|nr:urea carboxylase-associated family protein [Pseudomonadota bacterium]MBU1057368.1 urea carboxylase-associated family protein [Pseudomonadota bacterium]
METFESGKILFEKVIAGGWNWSHIIKRGTAVRLTDLEGGANVSALFYNGTNFSERYNMGDTLKIQHISYLAKGCCIYSDMGRILMSITDESCGWHDVICGVSDAGLIERRFGKKSYQQFKNSFYRNGYDSLLVELGKHGLGRRDFTETVNFFSKVAVDEDGNLSFAENASRPGDYVELRAEMDTLLVLDSGMHPLHPSKSYLEKPVQITISTCAPALPDDLCRSFCPENERGFINTEQYHL